MKPALSSSSSLSSFQVSKRLIVRSSSIVTTQFPYPRPLRTKKNNGIDILHDPLWNKSLAFDYSERDRLGLRGLIPPAVKSLDSQTLRAIKHIRSLPDDISKNLYLQELHNRNETKFHRVLLDYVSYILNLFFLAYFFLLLFFLFCIFVYSFSIISFSPLIYSLIPLFLNILSLLDR